MTYYEMLAVTYSSQPKPYIGREQRFFIYLPSAKAMIIRSTNE